ncbi:MAG: hypothetical protein ACKO7W_25010 [Elainella sp.]
MAPSLDEQTIAQSVLVGQALADGLSLAAQKASLANSPANSAAADAWTPEKWVQMGQSLSHIHPGI